MTLKERIIADIIEKYGNLESPDFRFVSQAVEKGMYNHLIKQLSDSFSVEDLTDYNDDVGPYLHLLSSNADSWYLRISFVGPYCILIRDLEKALSVVRPKNVGNSTENTILDLCKEAGLIALGTKELEEPVKLTLDKTEPKYVRVFQALFSDTEWMPWERYSAE